MLKPIIKVWAIRDKTREMFLPHYKSTRGYSFSEPISVNRPRLFFSRRSATAALAAWLRGYHVPLKDNDGYGTFTYGYKIEKCEGRKKENMEIVEFELKG